jgi:hypothetical protein
MGESISFQESFPNISREQALLAYKKFVGRGIASPDDLDLEDTEVIEANALFDQWQKQEDKKAENDIDAEQRINFEKTMFYVDAGFTDPTYLEEVLGWLAEDGMNVEKLPDNEKKMKLRADIADAIKKIRMILSSSPKV